MRARLWIAAVLASVALTAGCASAPRASAPPKSSGPAYPDFPAIDVPARLTAPADVRERHNAGIQRLQSGDLRGASTAFAEALKKLPAFYPSETGLGFVALAGRQFRPAVTRFNAALAREPKYLPALRGLVSAELGLDDVAEALAALERVIAVDPSKEADRTRLELLRVRSVQQLTENGRRARDAKRYADAEEAFTKALSISPASTTLMRELAQVELAAGKAPDAESRLRKALQLDVNDADTHAALAAVLEARGHVQEAATEYSRAAAIDTRWRSKAASAKAAAEKSGVPDEIRDLESAATVTRGQLAALIGVRLGSLLSRAPKRPAAIATDISSHWAAAWIAAVTQAGVMDVYSNHTFQPGATVRRSDLAQITNRLLSLVLADRQSDLTRWQAARPALADVSSGNVAYRAAAMSVTAGAMKTDEAGRFAPTKPATGADAVAAIARLQELGGR